MKMLGNSNYRIEYLSSVVDQDIKSLAIPIKTRIKKAIAIKLTLDPMGFGKPLRYSLAGHRRLRVGDYRVIYRIAIDEALVIIVAIMQQWPKKIMQFHGVTDFPPFESYRDELQDPTPDPFV